MTSFSHVAKSVIAATLVAAPIGDTTVLLLFSLTLECLLTLMLIRERCWRLRPDTRNGAAPATPVPFSLLSRTAPHLRARRPAASHVFVMARGSAPRWQTASSEATS
jgi:hypothetical protein